MAYKLAPSMMCCDLMNVKEQIKMFEDQRIDALHIDIMDGSFVPNIALGHISAMELFLSSIEHNTFSASSFMRLG